MAYKKMFKEVLMNFGDVKSGFEKHLKKLTALIKETKILIILINEIFLKINFNVFWFFYHIIWLIWLTRIFKNLIYYHRRCLYFSTLLNFWILIRNSYSAIQKNPWYQVLRKSNHVLNYSKAVEFHKTLKEAISIDGLEKILVSTANS